MAGTYGADHAAVRRMLAPQVAAGDGWCAEPVCLFESRWIPPSSPWDLAHNRECGGWRGPAHAKCNRSEGAAYGNRLRGLRRHGLVVEPDDDDLEVSWSSRDW